MSIFITTKSSSGSGSIPIMSDFVAYTPSFVGLGTVTAISAFSRRVGDSLEVRMLFTPGTATASTIQVGIGFNGTDGNVTIDSTKVPSISYVGYSTSNSAQGTKYAQQVYGTGGDAFLNAGYVDSVTAGLTAQAGNSGPWNSGEVISFYATVPITGWTTFT